MIFGIKLATVWKKINGEPIYYKRYLKTNIKSYGDAATEFYDKKIPKVGPNYTCLVLILIDFVLQKDGNY